jgi:hypothetical protein
VDTTVADLFAFIFRRYSEMKDFGKREEWWCEQTLIDGYAASWPPDFFPTVADGPQSPLGSQ